MTKITQADRDVAEPYLDDDGNDWPLQDLVLIKNALFCATEDPSLEEARRILYAMVPILDRHCEVLSAENERLREELVKSAREIQGYKDALAQVGETK